MAESDHSNASGTPLGKASGHASRMSLSNIQSQAPTVVPAPRSPIQSVHAFLELPSKRSTLEHTDASHRSRASSRAPSSVSGSSQVSTKSLKSARGRTFSEEKEVVLTRDGMPSPIVTSPLLTTAPQSPLSPVRDDGEEKDGFMRAMRTRIGSVGTLGAFAPSPDRAQAIASSPTVAPSPTRSQAVGPSPTRTQAILPSPTRTQPSGPSPTRTRAASSAALELENARRITKLLTAKEAPAPGLEGDREPQEMSPGQESTDGSIQADSPVILAAARQAKVNRAQMINHQPSVRRANSKASRVLGGDREAAIQEQGGIVLPPHVESPEPEPEHFSSAVEKTTKSDFPTTSSEVIELDNLPPTRPERPRHSLTLEEQADIVPALGAAPSATRRFSIFDALRSNPPDPAMIPKRAATAPSRRRKPTFTEDTSLDLQAAKKFDRENVVSTPYPAPDGQKESKFEKIRVWREGDGYEGLRREWKKGERARTPALEGVGVTVVLFSQGRAAPRVGEVVMPMPLPSELTLNNPHANPSGPAEANGSTPPEPERDHEVGAVSTDTLVLTPPPRANGKLVKKNARFKDPPPPALAPFDDEALARALRAEYLRLRGPLRVFFGARTLHGLRTRSYTYLSSLSSPETAQKPFRSRTSTSVSEGAGDGDGNGGAEGDDSGARDEVGEGMEGYLQTLLLSPRTGRGKSVVVDFLRVRHFHRKTNTTIPNEKLVLCFQENWAAGRLALWFGSTIALSLLATLLWVFVGVKSDGGQVGGGIRGSAGAGKDAWGSGGSTAGRVEGGVGLGLLVLLLGWTGMAGWVVLSWLVM